MEMILERAGLDSPALTAPHADVAHPASADAAMRQLSNETGADAAVAGDWAAYRRRCAFLDAAPSLTTEQAIGLRRANALAYLGERAQLHGGVFRASRPTVFTEAVVAALAKRNAAARFTRYPWLADMLALIAALDSAQHSVMSREGNVLSFPDGLNNRS